MKVGLIDIEHNIFNTAYMQIAAYHRGRGDTVECWTPLTDRQFDHVYCSSIFDYTDKTEVPARAICGGTGFDVTSRLSQVIENSDLDYSIYPKCDRSFVWFSRGCIRDCPWCIVRQKEGYIHSVKAKKLNPSGKYIVVQDNNFFANPEWEKAIKQLQKWGQPVDFQGIDARTLSIYRCEQLLTIRHYKRIKIAWDDPHEDLEPKLRTIIRYIKPWRLMCYVLIGYWHGEEELDLHRVETLRNLGIDPFVMPYVRSDFYQRAFARWVNHKAIFKKIPWQDYRYRVEKSEAAGHGWKEPK